MSHRRVGVDVDGVLSDFVSGFATLIKRETGRDVPTVVDSWNWYQAHGVTAAEEKELWKHVENNPSFWEYLEPLCHARSVGFATLHRWNRQHVDIYFVTNRPGSGAKAATERWLDNYLAFPPTVVITLSAKAKAQFAESVDLTHFVDDKPENVFTVRSHLPRCRAALFTASYNEGETVPDRIKSLEELL